MRATVGAFAIDRTVSTWLLGCVFFLTLYLAFIKRMCDLAAARPADTDWTSPAGYDDRFELNWLLGLSGVTVVLCWVLYTLSPHAESLFGIRAAGLALLTPFVVITVHRFYRRANEGARQSDRRGPGGPGHLDLARALRGGTLRLPLRARCGRPARAAHLPRDRSRPGRRHDDRPTIDRTSAVVRHARACRRPGRSSSPDARPVLGGSTTSPKSIDHDRNHVPVIRTFAEEWPNPDLVDYDSATTPGMHLLMAAVVRFGDSETMLQVLSVSSGCAGPRRLSVRSPAAVVPLAVAVVHASPRASPRTRSGTRSGS